MIYRWFKTPLDRNRHQLIRLFGGIYGVNRATEFSAGHIWLETSVVYGRRILAGVARYLRSHHRWSVFIEQHELGTPSPAWLTAGSWDGILSRPTDYAMAQLFRRMGVPVVDLNDLHEDLGLPWVGSDHAAIGKMGGAHLVERGFRHFAFCGFTGELWSRQRGAGFFNTVCGSGVTTSVYETPWRADQGFLSTIHGRYGGCRLGCG